TDLERRGRCGRAHQHVDLIEGAREIRGDELTHLLRLEVVRIVITGRQNIGAGHDPTLHFGTEALAPRALVQVHQVAWIFTSVSETYAIEAREVGGALSGRDDVVSRHRQRQVRQTDLAQLRPELFVDRQRLANTALVLWIESFVEKLLQQSNLESRQRSPETGHIVRHRTIHTGGVVWIEAGHLTHHQGRILRSRGDGASLIETGGKGDHAV